MCIERLSTVKVDRVDSEKYKVSFPTKLFKNVGEVLPYLFERLPLWSDLAGDPNFKRSYPYVATSKEEFLSWNVGKRLSAEVTIFALHLSHMFELI